jgi:hypothetical protein
LAVAPPLPGPGDFLQGFVDQLTQGYQDIYNFVHDNWDTIKTVGTIVYKSVSGCVKVFGSPAVDSAVIFVGAAAGPEAGLFAVGVACAAGAVANNLAPPGTSPFVPGG